MAPAKVLEYVAVHEVCHLLEMNHSNRFWHHVQSSMPDYETHRKWLKTSGQDLMLVKLSNT
jgi:predicted metal-dependent hydrolase